jgi:formylglycine-generating enzyme required for sulfatase activity
MEFVFVAGGTFAMGDKAWAGEPDERPVRQVRVCGFYLGVHEVTQAQWLRLMGHNPAQFQAPDHPVESVSWNDVQQFLVRLGRASGRTYRLPTEAEWEFAAREGGGTLAWAGTSVEAELPAYAWFGEPFPGSGHHPVGQKRPNALGLHDMSGNVREWTASPYASYAQPLPEGPLPEGLPERVYRGGAWDDPAARVRTGFRGFDSPGNQDVATGFRVALGPEPTRAGDCGGHP